MKSHVKCLFLTTSEDGDWLPEKGGRDFDAISAASKMTSVDEAARYVMDRINSCLRGAKMGSPNREQNLGINGAAAPPSLMPGVVR